ncbi:hypothetical protein IA05_12465 [Flavobacterium psychrophilum]|uniref:hypothetical protein n=1 Tax=Flavobacterium psychrophilum TaxID=96345 RepID=UPI0004D1E2A1|nr:hypothetical protein [Flavobacterium psychrophilum]AIG40288.1 hypothetical protein IA05_12465 [Flavobacterium psychrophilum]
MHSIFIPFKHKSTNTNLSLKTLNGINSIEALVDNPVCAYFTVGKSLSVKEFKNHLDEIITTSNLGEKAFTTDEAKGKIIRKWSQLFYGRIN